MRKYVYIAIFFSFFFIVADLLADKNKTVMPIDEKGLGNYSTTSSKPEYSGKNTEENVGKKSIQIPSLCDLADPPSWCNK